MDRTIKTLHRIIALSRNIVASIEAPASSFVSYLAASFTCTILENSSACFALILNNHYTAVPILIRNIMEAHIDLLNICKDENYKYILLYIFLNEKIRESEFATKDNPFTTLIYNLPEYKEQLCSYEKEFKELKLTVKEKHTRIKYRFKSVDKNLYTIYMWLCHRSHNNLDALEERHFNIEENRFELSVFRNAKESELYIYIDAISGILVKSIMTLFEYLQIENNKVNELGSLLEEIRASYSSQARSKNV